MHLKTWRKLGEFCFLLLFPASFHSVIVKLELFLHLILFFRNLLLDQLSKISHAPSIPFQMTPSTTEAPEEVFKQVSSLKFEKINSNGLGLY